MIRRLLMFSLLSFASSQSYADSCENQAPPNSPPSQASAAGFDTLVFYDQFTQIKLNNTQNYKSSEPWTAGFWFLPPQNNHFVVNDGSAGTCGLTLMNDWTKAGSQFATIVSHPKTTKTDTGTTFLYGYFEASLRFRQKSSEQTGATNNFGAFYLWSQSYTEHTDGFPENQEYCEIDIAEMSGAHFINNPEMHDWTVIDGVTAGSSKPNVLQNTTPIDPMDGQFHTYGLLWENGKMQWYIDNILQLTETSYPVCNIDRQILVLQSGSHGHDEQITDVQWVRVWH